MDDFLLQIAVSCRSWHQRRAIPAGCHTERSGYPHMQRLIYGGVKPYITEDERKLTELDLKEILRPLHSIQSEKHFNFLVTRIFPDRFTFQ